MHFFELISIESQKNADVSIFLKKEGKDITCTSQICIKFSFKYRNANKCIKIFKLHGTCRAVFN